LTTWQSQR